MPLHSLHITVATLFPATRRSDLVLVQETFDNDDYDCGPGNKDHSSDSRQMTTMIQQWKDVLHFASEMTEWPQQNFSMTLRPTSAQIAPRAGILLWNDKHGFMERIRSCLQKSVQSLHPQLQKYLRIPDIIHTTFLRFHRPPTYSNPLDSHQILQDKIVPHHPLFGSNHHMKASTAIIDAVRLVDCKIYLQGDNWMNDHPVYLTLSFGVSKLSNCS
jgi:hypothetical protein